MSVISYLNTISYTTSLLEMWYIKLKVGMPNIAHSKNIKEK